MKKLFLLSAVLATSVAATAAAPFQKGRTPVAQRYHAVKAVPARAAESQVLVSEDFSAFSAGSETEPAGEIGYINGYMIPESYTAQAGWSGGGVHPAGGAIALYPFVDRWGDSRNGYISTPKYMLNGTATLTFRARSLTAEGASMWVVICDDDYGPGYDELDLKLSEAWTDYTLVATQGSLDIPSYFQFMAEDGIALIDDVRLEFSNDRIATPYALPALNTSPTEFVARWEAVDGAKAYRLNVLCKAIPENPEQGEIIQNFDEINVSADGKTIDAENPNYPEGWTINLSEFGSQDVAADAADMSSAPVAVKIDAVGDIIESETTPYPIDGLSFWVRPTSMTDDEYGMSLLRVELYHATNASWEVLAHIPASWMEAAGGVYSFDKDALGDDVDRVRLSMIQRGQVDFYIDDLTMHYSDRGAVSKIVDDLDVETCEYTVSDINPVNEYSYYVQAVKGDIVSASSYVIWVDGVSGLTVETSDPSGISPTGFTASWQPLGHATDYKVECFRVIEPASDKADVVVLEENFDNIDEGTVQRPGTDWISPFDFSSRGWASTPWGATQPAWAKGMAGTTGTNYWMGTAGLVFTPKLDLSCYNGTGIKVEATVVTTVDKFEYDGISDNEGVYAMILRNHADTQPIASGYMETPVVGSNSGTITIANVPADADLSDVIIAFMNKSGLSFFVDYAKISMTVPAGATLMAPYTVSGTAQTTATFTGLDESVDHAYAVTASVTRNYETYTSNRSEIRVVRTSMSGVENVGADNAAAEVFASTGMINVKAADGVASSVYNMSGACIARGEGTCSLAVARGFYIVRVAGRSYKLFVD